MGVIEKKQSGTLVYFNQDAYTIQEIVERVAQRYDITIREKIAPEENKETKPEDSSKKKYKKIKPGYNSIYNAMYQQIKRKLDAIVEEEGEDLETRHSTRGRTTYPVDYVNRVINGELGPYFARLASAKKKVRFEELEKLATKYEKEFKDGTYGDFIADLHKTEEEMRSPEHEGDRYVTESVQYHKYQILMDIVFNHLIILDEDKLRADAAIALTADDATPSAQELEALERLKNYRNYYGWRTEELGDLLDN